VVSHNHGRSWDILPVDTGAHLYTVSLHVSSLPLPLDLCTMHYTISHFHIPACGSDIQKTMLKVSNAQSLNNIFRKVLICILCKLIIWQLLPDSNNIEGCTMLGVRCNFNL
jgi:hypothetical protein